MGRIEEVKEAILSDERRVAALRLVRELELPDGAVAGDFVRCALFDRLHDHPEWTQVSSIDVIYFDPSRPEPAVDESLRGELVARASRRPWRVDNLARARPDAKKFEEALDTFVDTASAVAVRFGPREDLEIVAPFGLDDLVLGVVRPTALENAGALRRRVLKEKWRRRYPKLRFAGLWGPGTA